MTTHENPDVVETTVEGPIVEAEAKMAPSDETKKASRKSKKLDKQKKAQSPATNQAAPKPKAAKDKAAKIGVRKQFTTTFNGSNRDDYVLFNVALKAAKTPMLMREIVAEMRKRAEKHNVKVRYSSYYDHVNSLVKAKFVQHDEQKGERRKYSIVRENLPGHKSS